QHGQERTVEHRDQPSRQRARPPERQPPRAPEREERGEGPPRERRPPGPDGHRRRQESRDRGDREAEDHLVAVPEQRALPGRRDREPGPDREPATDDQGREHRAGEEEGPEAPREERNAGRTDGLALSARRRDPDRLHAGRASAAAARSSRAPTVEAPSLAPLRMSRRPGPRT